MKGQTLKLKRQLTSVKSEAVKGAEYAAEYGIRAAKGNKSRKMNQEYEGGRLDLRTREEGRLNQESGMMGE